MAGGGMAGGGLPAVALLLAAGGLAGWALIRGTSGRRRPASPFPPPPAGPVVPADAGLGAAFRAVAYPAPDGTLLTAWAAPAAAGHPTVLMLAGPGRRLADLAPKAAALAEAAHPATRLPAPCLGVWLIARRPGAAPVPAAQLLADLRAALDHLTGQGISGSRLALYAEDAAAGLVAQMALERPPIALVLDRPRDHAGLGPVAPRLDALPPDCRLLLLGGDGSGPIARPFSRAPAWEEGGAAAVRALLAGGREGPTLEGDPTGRGPDGRGRGGLPARIKSP